MLVENTLFGEVDKVAIAIKRLQMFEPPEGYYLAFSGGKDSIVIKKLADMAGVKYDAHYSVTTIDPPELIYFMREHHKDVIWDKPKMPFLKMMVKRGFPQRQRRWCCKEYKEGGGSGRLVVTGVRWAESAKRANRKMLEACYNDVTRKFLHPIIDWADTDVWEFIRKQNLPYCRLYDENWQRIGCLFCPNATNKEKQLHAIRYPKFAKCFERAFQLLWEDRKAKGLKSVDRWESGKAMFDWWLVSRVKKEDKSQVRIFD